MEPKEIFNEILKSPKLQALLNLPEEELLKERFEETSSHPEIEAIKAKLNGQVRHTSTQAIMQNINRILMS